MGSFDLLAASIQDSVSRGKKAVNNTFTIMVGTKYVIYNNIWGNLANCHLNFKLTSNKSVFVVHGHMK